MQQFYEYEKLIGKTDEELFNKTKSTTEFFTKFRNRYLLCEILSYLYPQEKVQLAFISKNFFFANILTDDFKQVFKVREYFITSYLPKFSSLNDFLKNLNQHKNFNQILVKGAGLKGKLLKFVKKEFLGRWIGEKYSPIEKLYFSNIYNESVLEEEEDIDMIDDILSNIEVTKDIFVNEGHNAFDFLSKITKATVERIIISKSANETSEGFFNFINFVNFKNLTTLELSNCGLNNEMTTHLFSAFNRMTELKVLNLAKNKFTDLSFVNAGANFSLLRKLESLDLSSNCLRKECLQSLENYLKSWKSSRLSYLSFEKCYFNSIYLAGLFKSVSVHKGLTQLRVSNVLSYEENSLKNAFECLNSNKVLCLGIGDWGLGIGPNPQSPIPNPQSPIPNPQSPIN